MSKAKITLLGFDGYMKSVNDDLFSKLHVPTGIDKDLLINNILFKGGEFEVLYAEPYFMQNMIGVWADKWQHTMERWIKALSIDYNPLENYDRMEDWTDDASRVSNNQMAESSTNASNMIGTNNTSSNNSGSDTSETSSTNIHQDSNKSVEETERNESAIASDSSNSAGGGTTTNERSAFDASDYSPHDKSTQTTNGSNISTGVTSANGETSTNNEEINTGTNAENSKTEHSNDATANVSNISQNQTSSDETRNKNENGIDNTSSIHSGRMHGNIGVTTSQQMLQAELDIARWNLYDEIADLFLSELTIYIY